MIIRKGDSGPAVEDVQQKLVSLGYLSNSKVLGFFDDETQVAVMSFCVDNKIPYEDEITSTIWSRLVDESFELGDRTLYLRVPYFHGNDVKTLQMALNTLGFSCGLEDGIFGPHTEDALRKFQLNMALPSDGIVGFFTFRCIRNLSHSWKDKESHIPVVTLGFARAAEVLEKNLICLFGTTELTRSIAGRMSNLASATSSASKIASADSLLVEPDENTYFIQILESDQAAVKGIATVDYEPEEKLSLRVKAALDVSAKGQKRFAIRIPSDSWEGAGAERTAQHYAIVLLDALCAALAME